MDKVFETRVVLFADIGGSTELYDKIGDIEAHRQVAASLALMGDAIAANKGQLLRTVGDSALASFETADDALLAATEMQRGHEHMALSVRVGFHKGPVIPDKGDVYGNAVNIAARVASFARVDEIVATAAVVEALDATYRNHATFIDSIDVKGLAETVAIYRIGWKMSEESATVIASAVPAAATLRNGILQLSSASGAITVNESNSVVDIGRAEETAMPVNNEHASRYHARIEWRQGQFLLTDQSTNGTYIRKDGRNPLFLRRDTMVLEGNGTIGVGILPELDPTAAIEFDIAFT